MPSALTWIDFDTEERNRMQRVLALFRERDTRDELGLGGIRDSFSDQLFPGTSTIQTRLRYFLFIPWLYQLLEQDRVPGHRAASAGRALELRLMGALAGQDDREGVFGTSAGKALQRLPSSVYWSGLGTWGPRRFEGSQGEYHRALDLIYLRRRGAARRDDGEAVADPATITWDPGLPAAPEGFPDEADLRLTRAEAHYLQDSIASRLGGSLLAMLWERAAERIPDAERPWHLQDLADLKPEHRKLLYHAGLFSDVMHGAAIGYNLLLAQHSERHDLADEHAARFRRWWESRDLEAIASWSLDELWAQVVDRGHQITARTRHFVEAWVKLVRTGDPDIASRADTAQLIRTREHALKKGRARFVNRRALDQWSGRSGLQPITYRWPIVHRLLADLRQGLEAS